jgi:antitoxin VapB
MTKTTVFMNGRSQAVRIPKDFRFEGREVAISRLGDGLLLEPIRKKEWPEGFFDEIAIDDEGFLRPEQGQVPSSPDFDS